ncbi:MAG: replicative DNA helicase [bacterium]|nr:replicative DNA helicase [bacterium]
MKTSEANFEKLPQNYEAEQAVIGSMILDPEAMGKVLEILKENDFYRIAHRKIFSAIVELYELNQPVDLITLTENLRKNNLLEEIGGAAALTAILENTDTTANVEHHSKIVKEKSTLRELINAAGHIMSESLSDEKETDSILENAERLILDVSKEKMKQGFVAVKDILKGTFDNIEKMYQRKEYVTGVSTGFPKFDMLTAGLHKGDLIIVAGRPSMGKTSLCLTMAQNIAVEQKIPVAIFSLEMSREQLVQRLLCAEARVNAHDVRSGFIRDSDWPKLTIAGGKLAEAPIYIDDSSMMSELEMRIKARRLMSTQNVGLIIVDYLQLMQSARRTENRQQEITNICRSLKALAKELNVPVMVLSQLSRAVESRTDHKPQLSDLRESGSIEQDADLVIFIYRKEYYDDEPSPEIENIAEIIIGKQRNGPIGSVELTFIKEYTKFENLSHQEENG